MPDSAFLITAFATLFVVMDPPGIAPLFIALTRGMSPERRRAMARRACMKFARPSMARRCRSATPGSARSKSIAARTAQALRCA